MDGYPDEDQYLEDPEEVPVRALGGSWDMETFLKAHEEVFAESDSDRFDNDKEIWTNWVQELRYNLDVDQGSMEYFSRDFTYAIVDKEALTPVPSGAVKTICEKLVNAITARENSFGRRNSNVKFKAELEEILKDDGEFKSRQTMIRFCNIVDGVVTKWTAMNHHVESRKNKREQSIVDQKADKERSKSQKSNPAAAMPLLSTSVGEHCDGCGKPNHKRKDCTREKSSSIRSKKTAVLKVL